MPKNEIFKAYMEETTISWTINESWINVETLDIP